MDLLLEIWCPKEDEAIARAWEEERTRKELAQQDEFGSSIGQALLHAQTEAAKSVKLEEDQRLAAATVARDLAEFLASCAKKESDPLAAKLHQAELGEPERGHAERHAEAIEYVRRFLGAQKTVEMRLGDGMLTAEAFTHQRAQQPATEVDVGEVAEERGLAAAAEARQESEEQAERAASQRLRLEEEARKAAVARHGVDEKTRLAPVGRHKLEVEARLATVARHEADEEARLAAEERRTREEYARLVAESWVRSDEKLRLAAEERHGAEKRAQPVAGARIVKEQEAHKAGQRRFDAEGDANGKARTLGLAEAALKDSAKPRTSAADFDSVVERSAEQTLLLSQLAGGFSNLPGSQPRSGDRGGLWASAALVAVLAALGAGYWWGQSTAPATSAALPFVNQSVPPRLLDGPQPALRLRFEREPDIPKPAMAVQ